MWNYSTDKLELDIIFRVWFENDKNDFLWSTIVKYGKKAILMMFRTRIIQCKVKKFCSTRWQKNCRTIFFFFYYLDFQTIHIKDNVKITFCTKIRHAQTLYCRIDLAVVGNLKYSILNEAHKHKKEPQTWRNFEIYAKEVIESHGLLLWKARIR